jgi:hypothetical protein
MDSMRRSSSYAMRLANQRKSQDSWKLWRAVAIALLLPWTSRVRHRWHRTGMGRGAQGLRAQRVIALTGVALAIVALAGLSQKDKAFAYLEKAYQEKSPDTAYFLRADLRIDGLRSDSRFQDIWHRIGLPQ